MVVRAGLVGHRRSLPADRGRLTRCVCGWTGPGPALHGHIADAVAQLVADAITQLAPADEGAAAWTASGDPAPPRP